MNRDDFVIEIIVINKRPEKSYKKNSSNVTWTKEEEAQIKYYKYNTPTRKRMTWKKIGFKVNKSPALVKKIWHSIIEKEYENMRLVIH
jgi:hypothetical protein